MPNIKAPENRKSIPKNFRITQTHHDILDTEQEKRQLRNHSEVLIALIEECAEDHERS